MNTYWRKIFGWSKTRQSLWNECKLAYYYQYIGKWEGMPGDPERERLQKLSKLKKYIFWKGELIHKVIRNQIDRVRHNESLLEAGAKKYFVQEIEEVRQNPGTTIAEVVNGLSIHDVRFEEAKSDGLKQLDNFFTIIWPLYGERKLLECERLNSFQVNGTKVWAQVDLVTQTDEGKIIITDWKTGDERWIDEEKDEQMGVYILWAADYYGMPFDNIFAEFVFLRTAESKPIDRNEEQLENLKETILVRAQEMLSVQNEADFPPHPEERKCRECNFATICPEGMQFVALEQ